MHTKHLSLARKFAAARAAAANENIVMSLHASRGVGPCGWGCDGVNSELHYPGYERQVVQLELEEWGGIQGSRRMRNGEDIFFPSFSGRHPVVITHATLWDPSRKAHAQIELSRPIVLQPNDVVGFPCGSLSVADLTRWVPT